MPPTRGPAASVERNLSALLLTLVRTPQPARPLAMTRAAPAALGAPSRRRNSHAIDSVAARASTARPGPVGPRPLRTTQRRRAVQEGRPGPQRPNAHPDPVRAGRVRLDRPDGPARPVPLVGPVHPAQTRDPRRQDRRA